MSVEIPRLPKCLICNHEHKFAIQKALDDNVPKSEISRTYGINIHVIDNHIFFNHRVDLIAYGTMDYVIRKKAIDVGITLADFIERWSEGVKGRVSESIKDSDAIKAMELYLKAEGNLVAKHEITIKRSIEDALKDFLAEDIKEEEDEKKYLEEENAEIEPVKICETTGV